MTALDALDKPSTCLACGAPCWEGREHCHPCTVAAMASRGLRAIAADLSEDGKGHLGFKALGETYRFEVLALRELSGEGVGMHLAATYTYAPSWFCAVWAHTRKRGRDRHLAMGDAAAIDELYRVLAGLSSEDDRRGLDDAFTVGGLAAVSHVLAAKGLLG